MFGYKLIKEIDYDNLQCLIETLKKDVSVLQNEREKLLDQIENYKSKKTNVVMLTDTAAEPLEQVNTPKKAVKRSSGKGKSNQRVVVHKSNDNK